MTDPYPRYLNLLKNGELVKRTTAAKKILEHCTLCPWNCGIKRMNDEKGQCQTGAQARVYSYMVHHGEEKPLRGSRGSGTIFFSGCNLHCQYCQNYDISQDTYGLLVSVERLAGMMMELQARGCHNINLVSPTHVVPQILEALVIAAKEGLRLPLVYNTGGYDNVETLRLLDGIVDIYMPDMKYAEADIALRYSGVKDYPKFNQAAVKEMHRQVGDLETNENGIAERGLLIRHLVLPGQLAGTKEIMLFISGKISQNSYVNLMDQYRPDYHARDFPKLNRKVTKGEFNQAVAWAMETGLDRLD